MQHADFAIIQREEQSVWSASTSLKRHVTDFEIRKLIFWSQRLLVGNMSQSFQSRLVRLIPAHGTLW